MSGYRCSENQKLRRRKCLECGYRLKTLQVIHPEIEDEIVVPLLTKEEIKESRRANPKITTLTVQDVLEIKYFLFVNRTLAVSDLALQYGVTEGAILSIQRGYNWKDVPTPKSLLE